MKKKKNNSRVLRYWTFKLYESIIGILKIV